MDWTRDPRTVVLTSCVTREFFTNYPQYKNANIGNFILAVPFKSNKMSEAFEFKM